MLISELEKNATEGREKKRLLFTVVTFPVLVNVLGFSVMFDIFAMPHVENEHWWHVDEGVYIYRPSFISVSLKITIEGLDYGGQCLSAALRKTRGVNTWIEASAVSPLGASPSCPLAPSKLKPFFSAPIFHQCHAHYRRILPSTHTNNEGKWTHYCLGAVKTHLSSHLFSWKWHESPFKTISVWMKQKLCIGSLAQNRNLVVVPPKPPPPAIFLSSLFVCKASLCQWLCVWLNHSFIRHTIGMSYACFTASSETQRAERRIRM